MRARSIRKHREGTMKRSRGGIKEDEPSRRIQGSFEEEPGRARHARGIMEKETRRRNQRRGIVETRS